MERRSRTQARRPRLAAGLSGERQNARQLLCQPSAFEFETASPESSKLGSCKQEDVQRIWSAPAYVGSTFHVVPLQGLYMGHIGKAVNTPVWQPNWQSGTAMAASISVL